MAKQTSLASQQQARHGSSPIDSAVGTSFDHGARKCVAGFIHSSRLSVKWKDVPRCRSSTNAGSRLRMSEVLQSSSTSPGNCSKVRYATGNGSSSATRWASMHWNARS
eukprot:CAMPEP_0177788756 /NCGR_PEP_ID=MMETSP0491_2-20121128/22319_1 /TAXON_ID=63592 /ORGANISM="Tetraselmis chuii, Strain PLY429" /LENGTH=107 /DNA_ID=CAMNT_0019310441 /DNA_START=291 /DNA_END=611 /DNA_ORIENTATION=-